MLQCIFQAYFAHKTPYFLLALVENFDAAKRMKQAIVDLQKVGEKLAKFVMFYVFMCNMILPGENDEVFALKEICGNPTYIFGCSNLTCLNHLRAIRICVTLGCMDKSDFGNS